jgi:hypothetical protein
MITSEHTYSLLSNIPVRIANGDRRLYYWRGIALVEPMVLAIVSSVIFRIPISPEVRKIAGAAQRRAIIDREIVDSQDINTDYYSNQDIDQVYYHVYVSAVRNQFQEPGIFDRFTVSDVLNWVKPEESM